MGTEHPIIVENVTKKFRIDRGKNTTLKDKVLRRNPKTSEYIALDEVTLAIEKGAAVGLIGVNGSGKSTLLKLISRILYPDTGHVQVNGKVSSLLELGAGFHPDFTGRENTYMNAALLGLTKKQVDGRIEEIIDFSGLRDFIDQPVRGYSSGMYMRLAFSVATMIDADILLIDEVLAVGDAAFQAKCFSRLRELRMAAKTIVIVTHDLGSVEKFCDRAVWLDGGQIIADGKPRDVIQQYLAATFASTAVHGTGATIEPGSETIESMEITSSNGRRWGSGEVVITEVLIHDNNSAGVHISGEPFEAEIRYSFVPEYQGGQPLMFGMNITDSEGRSIFGTNTSIDGFEVELDLARSGSITFRCDKLQLLEGHYSFDASVYRIDGTPFDHRIDCAGFSVVNPRSEAGITRLEHSWKLRGDY